jgi:hypothetical protein
VKSYVSSSVNVEYDTQENNVVRMEVDNHVDTTCFGSNFMLAYYAGKVCDVAPYSEEYQAMHDISVAGAYIAYDDPETGLTYILEFHEGLWFGSRLKNSLWNPNQSRAFGLSLCDDPFDPNPELGFYDPVSDMSVLHEMDSVAFLKTCVPSIDEVHSCPHIVMTSDAEWDLKSLSGHVLTQEEKEQMHITAGVKVSDVNIDAYPNENNLYLAHLKQMLCL